MGEGEDSGQLLTTRVQPADIAWIDGAIDTWDCSLRWSLRGRTPSRRWLTGLLWHGVPVQVAARRPDGTPAGLLQLVEVDLDDGVADLGLLLDPDEATELGVVIDAFVDRVFEDLPLRKLSVRAAEDQFDPTSYPPVGVDRVGTMPAHQRRGEHLYADVLLYEIWGSQR